GGPDTLRVGADARVGKRAEGNVTEAPDFPLRPDVQLPGVRVGFEHVPEPDLPLGVRYEVVPGGARLLDAVGTLDVLDRGDQVALLDQPGQDGRARVVYELEAPHHDVGGVVEPHLVRDSLRRGDQALVARLLGSPERRRAAPAGGHPGAPRFPEGLVPEGAA